MRIVSVVPAGPATTPLDEKVMPVAAPPTGVTVLVPASAGTLCNAGQAAPPQSALFVSTTTHPPAQAVPPRTSVPPTDGHTVMPVGEATLTASLRA